LFGGTMGVNIVYEHVAARVSQRLMNWRDKDLKGDLFWRIQNKLARWFNKPPVPKQVKLQTDTCFICQHQEKFAQYAMWSLFRELGRNNSGFKTQYSNSDGICLPHLQKGLSICSYSFPDGCEYIVDDTIRRLKCQRVHMMEYIRKHSWNYRHETYTSEEKMAWKHTLTCFSGYPPMEFDSNA